MVTGLNALLNETLKQGGTPARAGCISRLPKGSQSDSSLDGPLGGTKRDALILSEPLRALRGMGLDLEGSLVTSQAQMVSFNLNFTDEHVRNLTSNGFYDLRSQSLTVDFSFASALTVKDETTGEEHQELFQFDFHLEASHVQAAWGDQKVQKEDILHFARKIVNKLSKLHSEGKEIDGLALDDEDLRELAAVDEGRLLKSIMQIIELMRNMDRLRGKNGDHVWLNPERGKALITEGTKREEQSFKMSLSVRRISAEASQTDGEEAPPKADSVVEHSPDQPPPASATTTEG